MKFILLVVAACVTASQGVNWNGNNWAMNCDFSGNDLTHARIPGSQCGSRCASTQGCTHFTWTSYEGGTCWMKQGAVCKDSAVDKQGGVCGFTTSTCDGPNPIPPINKPVQSGPALKKFTNCKFTYGITWEGDSNPTKKNYAAYDFINKWIGEPDSNCKTHEVRCTDWNDYWAGKAVRTAKELNKPMALYMYITAFEAKNLMRAEDCNVGHPNLCEIGANFIRSHRSHIIQRYEYHTKHIADILGRNTFAIYMIEPDFVQYYRNGNEGNQQGGTISGPEMASLFKDIVAAIKRNHPAASIAWDISPWLNRDEMTKWWNYFHESHSQIDFLFTSGGGAQANSPHIHGNEIEYKFMHDLTKKPIISDTGYGVNGVTTDNSGPWYDPGNINARANDGVVATLFNNGSHKPNVNRNVC